jgi:hypothetical protein
MGEIEDLVFAFNQAEQEQENRLKRLWVLVAARHGARNVYFGNHRQWCQFEGGVDLKGLVNYISEVNKGGE